MKRAALLLPCLLAVAVGPLAEPPSAELQKRWQANLDAPGWTELRMATRDLLALGVGVDEFLKERLAEGDTRDRRVAARTIGIIGEKDAPRAAKFMAETLKAMSDKDPVVRAEATIAVARAGVEKPEDAARALVEAVLDPSRGIQATAGFGLSLMNEKAWPAMIERLEGDDVIDATRLFRFVGLRTTGNSLLNGVLGKAIASDRKVVRRNALHLMRRLKVTGYAFEHVRELLLSDPEAEVRTAAARALATLARDGMYRSIPEAILALKEASSDEDAGVSAAAKATAAELQKALDNLKSPGKDR
ncbi:MAG: HEAT repeat domain-containing protein [Planctomycetia bacterium]|nr:HEAT repeat domain-containing protein [Planctomycetia bacterium]